MIEIDAGKCNACGLCVRICHEHCLQLADDTLLIDRATCSTCTQCIAVCPVKAITWAGVPPEPFNREAYPSPAQVMELFMERRTTRDYRARKIDRQLLQEIGGAAVYAPTHSHDLRIIIVDDEEILSLVDRLLYSHAARLYRWLFRPRAMQWIVRVTSPVYRGEFARARPKLEAAIKRKKGFKSRPAAMILLAGNRKVPLSLESAQYGLYNMDLYAQSRGIACRNLVGNQGMLNRVRSFRRAIGLERRERIFGVLTLGYPAVRFSNKVLGRSLPLQWNGEPARS